jgi:hypothetical protein
MDRQWRGQEGAGAWELTGRGGKWRAEHGGSISGLTGARAVVWCRGDGDEAAVEKKLGGGSTQVSREGVGEVRSGGGVSLLLGW